MSPGATEFFACGIVRQQLEGKFPLLESFPDVDTQRIFPARTVKWQPSSESAQLDDPAAVLTTTVPVAALGPTATLMVSN
jgi:hypothetical protein